MSLPSEKIGDILIVSPTGQVNSSNAAGIEADLLAHLEKGERRIVVDFSRLEYISSAGLRVLLVLAKKLKQEAGVLVLCGLRPHVEEVFEISGFLAILSSVKTREEALAQLGAD